MPISQETARSLLEACQIALGSTSELGADDEEFIRMVIKKAEEELSK